jgi:hypothetical protein
LLGEGAGVRRGLIHQAVAVPFPFVVARGGVDESNELELRADDVAGLGGLSRVRMRGVKLPDGAEVELELTRIDLAPLEMNFRIDGEAAPGILDGLDLSVWTSVPGSTDEAMLSFSQFGCRGWIRHAGVLHHLLGFPDGNGDWYQASARLVTDRALAQEEFESRLWCATVNPAGPTRAVAPSSPGGSAPMTTAPSRFRSRVRVALETDYQLFGVFGSVPAELAYLATMFAWVSHRFEQQVRVVLTFPYVQVYTNPADPWSTPETPGATCIDLIYEFQAAWQGNLPDGADLGHFLSGVHLGCAAGFRPGVCNAPNNFSVMTAVNGMTPFPIAQGPSNWDFIWICHELGHNFDAIHTHEYCPPLDRCPPVGYFGPCQMQQVCTNQGTLMSYCNSCPGGMNNFTTYFHHQSVADMRAWLVSSGCLPLY